ncbi:MAG: hypothetical protein F7C36_04240 [Desulfurococcales archaeon]|nr:hypothetical protein [Desulfurococcales archaeon]
MLSNSHHVIPGAPSGATTGGFLNITGQHILVNTTYTPQTTTAIQGNPEPYNNLWSLLGTLAIYAIVFLITLYMIYTLYRKENPVKTQLEGIEGTGIISVAYSYQGLRKKLRQIYLYLRSSLEQSMGKSYSSKTMKELAKVIDSPESLILADHYDKSMYGKGEPTIDEVNFIESTARGLVDWLRKH